MFKKLDFGGAVNLQIFVLVDWLLLDEATKCFFDLVIPEVLLHAVGVLPTVGRLPKKATPGQEVEQEAGRIHVRAAETNFLVWIGF